MPSIRDNMDRLVQATLDGFNTWDYDAIRATRSDDFIYQYLPTSLGAQPRNNEVDAEHFKNFMTPTFSKFKATPKTITHDPETRRSVMYANVDAETAAGAWSIEIVMIISFDEAAEKITRIDEFFDSLVMAQQQAKLKAMQAEN